MGTRVRIRSSLDHSKQDAENAEKNLLLQLVWATGNPDLAFPGVGTEAMRFKKKIIMPVLVWWY